MTCEDIFEAVATVMDVMKLPRDKLYGHEMDGSPVMKA